MNILDIGKAIFGKAAEEAAESTIGKALAALTQLLYGWVLGLLDTIGSWWLGLEPLAMGEGSAVHTLGDATRPLVAVIGTAGFVFALVKVGRNGGAREDTTMVVEGLMRVAIAGAVAVPGVQLLMAFSAEFAPWIFHLLSNAAQDNQAGLTSLLPQDAKYMVTEALGGVMLIILPFMLIGSVIQAMMALGGDIASAILAAMLPLTAAASTTAQGNKAFWKQVGWIISCVLFKPVAAMIYGFGIFLVAGGNIGADVKADAQPMISVIAGFMTIILALFSLPALISLVAPMAGVLGSSGGRFLAAAGGAAVGAAFTVAAGFASGGASVAAGAGGSAASGAAGASGAAAGASGSAAGSGASAGGASTTAEAGSGVGGSAGGASGGAGAEGSASGAGAGNESSNGSATTPEGSQDDSSATGNDAEGSGTLSGAGQQDATGSGEDSSVPGTGSAGSGTEAGSAGGEGADTEEASGSEDSSGALASPTAGAGSDSGAGAGAGASGAETTEGAGAAPGEPGAANAEASGASTPETGAAEGTNAGSTGPESGASHSESADSSQGAESSGATTSSEASADGAIPAADGAGTTASSAKQPGTTSNSSWTPRSGPSAMDASRYLQDMIRTAGDETSGAINTEGASQ